LDRVVHGEPWIEVVHSARLMGERT
jgi:hypothetical protein